MRMKLVTEPQEAREIWDSLSPHETIDDEWDFRFSFIKSLPYKLRFFVGYEADKPVALIPLQENTGVGLMPPYSHNDRPFLEFFGGDDTDDNKILCAPGYLEEVTDFLKDIKMPIYLAPLAITYRGHKDVKFYENKYYLDLKDYKNSEDFLKNEWSKSSRKTILKQIRRIYRDHKVEIFENRLQDLDLLVEYNKKRFGKESSFDYPYRKQIFKDLTEKYDVKMLSVEIDGKTEAVAYGIKYKDVYVGMNAGVSGNIEDLPKLLVLTQIDKAIEWGCKTYDAGKGDSGWKESYKLQKVPQYQLEIA